MINFGCWNWDNKLATPKINIDIEVRPICTGHNHRIWTITFDFIIDNEINAFYPIYFNIPVGGDLGELCAMIIKLQKK